VNLEDVAAAASPSEIAELRFMDRSTPDDAGRAADEYASPLRVLRRARPGMHHVDASSALGGLHPLGEWARSPTSWTPSSISNRATFVTGETLHVDGGRARATDADR